MKRLYLSFILLSFFVSCNTYDNPILNYRVLLELDLYTKDKVLRGIPSYKTYTRPNIDFIVGKESIGFGGVVVVNTTIEGYQAFDLACPFEADRNILVQVDDNIIQATCPKCKRTYEIGTNGIGASQDGEYYLKKYKVNKVGEYYYTVYNPHY